MALVLALAAPASAQSPIAGGGSFNDAPVLAPGKYKDTLRGGEQLFYAVTLKPGQQLTAGATVSGRTESSYFMRMSIYSPLREKDVFKGTQTDSLREQRQERVAAGRGPAGGGEGRRQLRHGLLRAGDVLRLGRGRRPGAQPGGGPVRHADRPAGDRQRDPDADAHRDRQAGGDGRVGADGRARWGRRGRLGRARDDDRARAALGGLVGFGVRRLRA